MSVDQARIDKILRGKEAVRLVRADKDHMDSMLDYVGGLEQQLRVAAAALERAKDLVGKTVTVDKWTGSYGRDKTQQPAHDWFDEHIAAARLLIDTVPTAPVL